VTACGGRQGENSAVVEQATCADLVGASCIGSAFSYQSCLAQCSGLAPVDCADGTMVSGYARCDGASQCANDSDEAGCTGEPRYKCRNVSQFIASSLVCDGHKDCTDGSDELVDCVPGIMCKVGGSDAQLTVASTCNGVVECDDKSDEPAGCATFTCPK
jgi:hypothetical protein